MWAWLFAAPWLVFARDARAAPRRRHAHPRRHARAVLGRGDVAGLVAFALFAVGIARKVAIEEALLTGRFGAEYVAYRSKVAAIIPFIL
jgi:protein-S-isoprenylcysteine O-methyltransferase Ste14